MQHATTMVPSSDQLDDKNKQSINTGAAELQDQNTERISWHMLSVLCKMQKLHSSVEHRNTSLHFTGSHLFIL